jgi:hypothetical protein
MGKYKVMAALFAVFAFSAVVVASASAHEWLTLSGGTISKVESATTVGTIELHNKNISELFGGGEVTVLCMGQFLGTVGPNGTDLISLFENLSAGEQDKLSCTVSKSTNRDCPVGTLVTVEPVNLPWATKLVLSGSVITDDLTADKGGKFGYKVNCVFADECTNELELSTFAKNISTGAEFSFNESEKANCSIGEGTVSATGGVVLGFLVN